MLQPADATAVPTPSAGQQLALQQQRARQPHGALSQAAHAGPILAAAGAGSHTWLQPESSLPQLQTVQLTTNAMFGILPTSAQPMTALHASMLLNNTLHDRQVRQLRSCRRADMPNYFHCIMHRVLCQIGKACWSCSTKLAGNQIILHCRTTSLVQIVCGHLCHKTVLS
jgi:hypothetical protein